MVYRTVRVWVFTKGSTSGLFARNSVFVLFYFLVVHTKFITSRYIVSIFEFSPRIAALAPPNIDFVLLVLTGLEEGGRMLSKGFEFIICKYFIVPT